MLDIALPSKAAMGIEVRNITKTFGAFTRCGMLPFRGYRRIGGAAGAVGFGKNDAAADHRGAGRADAGSGAILFREEDVARRSVGSRQVGFVFQHYALFRHMTVFENVALGSRAAAAAAAGRNLINSRSCGC